MPKLIQDFDAQVVHMKLWTQLFALDQLLVDAAVHKNALT